MLEMLQEEEEARLDAEEEAEARQAGGKQLEAWLIEKKDRDEYKNIFKIAKAKEEKSQRISGRRNRGSRGSWTSRAPIFGQESRRKENSTKEGEHGQAVR